MNRSIASALLAASLTGVTIFAVDASAQEEPAPSVPGAVQSGTVELELVDQSFDITRNGDIDLTYRITGDLATVAELTPPTTTTTTAPPTTTTAPTSVDTTPPETAVPAPTAAPTTTIEPAPSTTLPPPVALTVQVLNYEAVDEPSELTGLLGSDPTARRFPPLIDVVDIVDVRSMIVVDDDDVATLRLTVLTDVKPSVAERLEFGEAGIHPILVLLLVDDQVVARHGTVVEWRSGIAPPPVDLSFIAAVDDPGPTADDAAFAQAAEELHDLLEMTSVVDAQIALGVPPSVAAAALTTTRTRNEASEILADEAVLSAPATPFDVSSAAAVDRVDAFERQLIAGEDDMRSLLGVVTVRDVWLTTEPLSAEGAQVLRTLGVRYLAMPADVYANTVAEDRDSELPARDRFVELDLPDGSTMPTLLIDDETGAMFEAERTAEILADQTPTEWAIETIARWRVDQYAAPRSEQRDQLSRLISAPGLGSFDPILVVALEEFANHTAAIQFAPANVLASVTDVQERVASAALPQTAGPSLAARLDDIAAVQADLEDTASMLPVDDVRPQQWTRRLDSFVSTSFTDDSVTTQLDELTDEAAQIRGGVVPPAPFTFTLTGREGPIQLRIGNELDEPLNVVVRLSSPRLSFPEGDISVTLPAADTIELDVPVIARSNGTSSVAVEILTPLAERPLIEPVQLTSRVNALTGLGQVLTAAFVLILASWWISSWRSKRRERDAQAAAGTHPSAKTDRTDHEASQAE